MWGQSPLAIVLTYRLNHPAISDLSRSLNCSQTVCRSHLSPTLPPLPECPSPDCVLTSCAWSDRYRRANTAAAALVAATAIAAATAIVVAVRRRRRC